MNRPLQLSRAELLVLLGALNLPLPLALGDDPLDQDLAGLGVALATATASLAARDLLALPVDPTEAPVPAPGVADLLADCALADACLIHTRNGDPAPSVVHVTRRGTAYVVHSCPLPGVHRLERLRDQAAVVAQMFAALSLPNTSAEQPPAPQLTLPAEVLAGALDAVCSGDRAGARARLLAAGAPVGAANALSTPASDGPVRHALVALRGLTGAAPEVDGALVLGGMANAWLGTVTPHDPAKLTLAPAPAAVVRARVDALAAWMG